MSDIKKTTTRKSHMMPTKMAELIVAGNPELGVNATKYQEICESLFEYIILQTKHNEKINFPNFLKFERVKRAERTFKNPNQVSGFGEPVVKPERYALVVTVMAAIKKDFEEIPVLEGEHVAITLTSESENEKDDEDMEPKPSKKPLKTLKPKAEKPKAEPKEVKPKADKPKAEPKPKKGKESKKEPEPEPESESEKEEEEEPIKPEPESEKEEEKEEEPVKPTKPEPKKRGPKKAKVVDEVVEEEKKEEEFFEPEPEPESKGKAKKETKSKSKK